MHPAPLISQGDGDRTRLAEAEVPAMVMIVRGDPAHPHWRRVLSSEHSHWVVVLPWETHSPIGYPYWTESITTLFRCHVYFSKFGLIYSCDASIVNSSIFFCGMTAETKTAAGYKSNKEMLKKTHLHLFQSFCIAIAGRANKWQNHLTLLLNSHCSRQFHHYSFIIHS